MNQTIISFHTTGQAAAVEAHRMKGLGFEVVVAGPAEFVVLRTGETKISGLDDANVSEWYAVMATNGQLAAV